MDRGLIEAAERLHAARRARDALFGADRDGFGEPAWDMLLELVVAEGSDGLVEAAELVGTCGHSTIVGARYLEWLLARELAHQQDERVGLSSRGRALMADYLRLEKRVCNR